MKTLINSLFNSIGISLGTDRVEHPQEWYDHFLAFGFYPEPRLLIVLEYQKEVLMSLSLLAEKARRSGEKKQRAKSDNAVRYNYRDDLTEYRDAVDTAKHFYPEFRNLPLHWTQLEKFIKQWQNETGCRVSSRFSVDVPMLED